MFSVKFELCCFLISKISKITKPAIMYPVKTKINTFVEVMRLYIKTKPDSAMANRETPILLRLRAADFRDSDRREKFAIK